MGRIAGVFRKTKDSKINTDKIFDFLNFSSQRENTASHNILISDDINFAGGETLTEQDSLENISKLSNPRQILLIDSDEITKEKFLEKTSNLYDLNWVFNRTLEGFAVAIYNQDDQSLILANDKLGKKTIFYTEFEGKLYFSTSLKSIIRNRHLTIDPNALYQYMHFGFIPAPRTIYSEVKKLPPASTLTVKQGISNKLKEYYSFHYVDDTEENIIKATKHKLNGHLKTVVRRFPEHKSLSFAFNNSQEGLLVYNAICDYAGSHHALPISYTVNDSLNFIFEPFLIRKSSPDEMVLTIQNAIQNLDEPCAMPEFLSSIFELKKARIEATNHLTMPSNYFLWDKQKSIYKILNYFFRESGSHLIGETLFGKIDSACMNFHPNIKPYMDLSQEGIDTFYVKKYLQGYFQSINSLTNLFETPKVSYPLLDMEILEHFASVSFKGTKRVISELLDSSPNKGIKLPRIQRPQSVFSRASLLREELKHLTAKTFSRSRILELGLFSDTELQNLLIEHLAKHEDNSSVLWKVFVLDQWLENSSITI